MKSPYDIPKVGRIAGLTDPEGAVFCLWQPQKIPATNNDKNSFSNVGWNEFMTNNIKRMSAFYSDLFNWEVQAKTMPNGHDYITFVKNQKPIAGMIEIQGNWQAMPPHWEIYFSVDDFDTTISKINSQGGQVMYDPVKYPDVGLFTMIRDPQGALFSIVEFEKQA